MIVDVDPGGPCDGDTELGSSLILCPTHVYSIQSAGLIRQPWNTSCSQCGALLVDKLHYQLDLQLFISLLKLYKKLFYCYINYYCTLCFLFS